VYFQFDAGANPYALIQFRKGYLVTDQPYDVDISLNLPRTPNNRAQGNFMVDVTLLSASLSSGDQEMELLRERRPAILTYYSPIMEYVHRAIDLPWFVFGWRKEQEKLVVPILEEVEFARGWRNLPSGARVELSNAGHLQIYSAEISFKARLRGLRYVSYRGGESC
jgi:seipin